MSRVLPTDPYVALAAIPPATPVRITRDRKLMAIVPDVAAVFNWFHRHTSHSVAHALTHEGYAVEAA